MTGANVNLDATVIDSDESTIWGKTEVVHHPRAILYTALEVVS